MKKIFSFAFVLVTFVSASFSQTTTPPTPSTPSVSLKTLLIREWKFTGSEEFGVLTNADTIVQRYDAISFTVEGLYTKTTNDVTTTGKWTLNETTRQLFCTDGATGKQTMYTVKKCNPTEMKLNFQAADLTSTIYHYSAK